MIGSNYSYHDFNEKSGRVTFAQSLVDATLDREYDYDHVGRLVEAHTGAEARAALSGQGAPADGPYSQSYRYDEWGNMWARVGWGGWHATDNATFTNNRRDGLTYDAAGNFTAGGAVMLDAVGHQVSNTGAGMQHFFDGDGLRVKKVENGSPTYYLRSSVLGGQVVAELNGSGGWTRGYVYMGGQLLAIQDGSVVYVHQDPVTKSQRLTDTSGNIVSGIELDPWGGETSRSWNQGRQPHRFTSYERDSDGGDDAQARKYGAWWSRFSQPDPFDGSYDLSDPQSFNRYSYVQNDPVNFTDPSGLLMSSGCSAEYSYSQCGGDAGFWGGGGGGGGGWGFGDDVGFYNEEYGGLPPNIVASLRIYNQRVSNAMGGNGFRTNEEIIRAQAMLCRSADDCWDAGIWVSISGGSGRTFGWGVTAGGSATYGLVGGGFIDGNISVGQFRRGNLSTSGATATGGASVGLPSRSGEIGNTSAPAPLPNSYPAVVGRSAGVGAGLFFTNAGRVEQLRGPFYTQQLNTPLFSIRYDSDNSGTRVLSVTFGPTLGASYFRGTTNTYTTPSLPTVPTGGTTIYVPRR